MYATQPISGAHLPDKTLCLTYDDGPGEHTLAIAQFLYEQGIKATFFVVGKYAVEQQLTLARLQQMGHILGNHTYDHPDLPYYISVNGDLQNQVLRTDAIIKPYTRQPIFFRAPYGKWSSEVVNHLNTNLLCTINHIGPIHWDIAGIDCYYWLLGKSIQETLDSYLNTIRKIRKGIVVMHDDVSDMDTVKPLNQTLTLTKQLIPILKAEGYCFVGLDEVIAQSPFSENKLAIRLKSTNGKFVSQAIDGSFTLLYRADAKAEIFTIEELQQGKIALKTALGKYLCLQPENKIAAIEFKISPQAQFDLVPVFDNQLMLRTYNGNFITTDTKTGQLTAEAKYMRSATIFTYHPLHTKVEETPITFQMRYRLWKKRLAFIKSKLLSS